MGTEINDVTFRNAKIVSDLLAILPVGYIPNHTPESITERVKDIVFDYGRYQAALEKIAKGTRYAKEIAENAIGYEDDDTIDIDDLREENLLLKLKIEELEKQYVINDTYGRH